MKFALINKNTCVVVAGKYFYSHNFSKLPAESSNKTPGLNKGEDGAFDCIFYSSLK